MPVELSEKLSLKSIAALIGCLSVVIGAVIGIESRYAHAGDVKSSYNRLELQMELTSLRNREWLLHDKVGTLELKPPTQRTDFDRAQLDRYKRELDSTQEELRRLSSELRKSK